MTRRKVKKRLKLSLCIIIYRHIFCNRELQKLMTRLSTLFLSSYKCYDTLLVRSLANGSTLNIILKFWQMFWRLIISVIDKWFDSQHFSHVRTNVVMSCYNVIDSQTLFSSSYRCYDIPLLIRSSANSSTRKIIFKFS